MHTVTTQKVPKHCYQLLHNTEYMDVTMCQVKRAEYGQTKWSILSVTTTKITIAAWSAV